MMSHEERRCWAGRIYIFIGVLFLLFAFFPGLLQKLLSSLNKSYVFWCIAWSSIGVGVGLINTRDHDQSHLLHLIGYWGFALVVTFFASFAMAFYLSEITELNRLEPLKDMFKVVEACKFYSFAALIGLIGGFLGHELHDLLKGLIDRSKK